MPVAGAVAHSPTQSQKEVIPVIDYMSIEEQVEVDFARARRKGWVRRLLFRLTKGPGSGRMSCFAEVRGRMGAAGGVRVGRRDVRSEDIVGSVGRCSEFDAAFLPMSKRARKRWERIDRAFRRGDELPPVSLYEVDGSYFVLDGNHRVSVARYHGVEWLDAEVTAFHFRLPETGNASATALSRSTALAVSVT